MQVMERCRDAGTLLQFTKCRFATPCGTDKCAK